MIPQSKEPKGLPADAKPFEDNYPVVSRLEAGRGSADLRDAILTCLGYSAPIRLPDRRPRRKKAVARPGSLPRPVPPPLPCQTAVKLQQRIAEHYGISVDRLLSPTKEREVCVPRQAGMYLLRKLTDKSYPDIARLFGRRDHTTAIHAVREIEKRRAVDPALNASLEYLGEELAE